MRFLVVLPPVAAVLLAVHGLATADDGKPAEADEQHQAGQAAPGGELGATLYATQCASCHGVTGEGVDDRGPDLIDEGEAAVDFALRTGRMPAANTTAQVAAGPVRYNEQEIVALVEHVGAFGDGPDIPMSTQRRAISLPVAGSTDSTAPPAMSPLVPAQRSAPNDRRPR